MKLIVIDDDPIVSMSLKTILETAPETQVIAVGHDGSEALELYRRFTPDVLLMDIQMKSMNGLAGAKEILSVYPEARIVFLTTFSDTLYIQEAIQLGAKGYLLKQDFAAITAALKSIMAGQVVFGNEIISKFQAIKPSFENVHELTEKELELLEAIAKGLNNKELAAHFGYSEGTIRNQISLLLEKIKVRDRTQLVIYYFNHLK